MSQTLMIAEGNQDPARSSNDRAPALSHAATVQIVERRLRGVGVLHFAYAIALRRHIPHQWVLGTIRNKRAPAARRELWALLYGSLAPISFPELGWLVARDHTTIMTGLRLREEEVIAELRTEGLLR